MNAVLTVGVVALAGAVVTGIVVLVRDMVAANRWADTPANNIHVHAGQFSSYVATSPKAPGVSGSGGSPKAACRDLYYELQNSQKRQRKASAFNARQRVSA